jgi:hypothetical protein
MAHSPPSPEPDPRSAEVISTALREGLREAGVSALLLARFDAAVDAGASVEELQRLEREMMVAWETPTPARLERLDQLERQGREYLRRAIHDVQLRRRGSRRESHGRRPGHRHVARATSSADPGDDPPAGSRPRLALAPKPGAIYTFGVRAREVWGLE